MQGQYTIEGLAPRKKRRPCEYSFPRYIGQRVRDNGEHIIAEIKPYYTIYTDGMVGTPHSMVPADPEEREQARAVEMEYQEYRSRSKDAFNRSMAERNLRRLRNG